MMRAASNNAAEVAARGATAGEGASTAAPEHTQVVAADGAEVAANMEGGALV